jgi:hypothetical protein
MEKISIYLSDLFHSCILISTSQDWGKVLSSVMKKLIVLLLVFACTSHALIAQTIPLPEHPRPDFERVLWQNLNGVWQFAFDSLDVGLEKKWNEGNSTFAEQITVPFPWGSVLSGVKDKSDIAWYQRTITVPSEWKNKRTFLTVGASDWETTIWLDGALLGKHNGGYTPFSFELTPHLKYGQQQKLVVRVDDKRRDFTLYGKQGYGNARGIWQTVYLEARGSNYIDAIHFRPDIEKSNVVVTVYLPEEAATDQKLSFTFKTPGSPILQDAIIPKGKDKINVTVPIPQPRLWSLTDPYLYEVVARLNDDVVKTYFGMRKISVTMLPGTDYPYVALNNKPIYLQLALDQSYHPEGFYTFPSDAFMRREVELAKSIGLNGIRPHIKVEIPRKLYWADKLGVLIMADLPNSWGDPDAKMQYEAEETLRKMIKRDFNHPAIFTWTIFNETWGLRTHVEEDGKRVGKYLPETQQWVSSMYYLAKSLDPTRLAEDNSICCGAGHTQTDLNSFHDYLAGWEWEANFKNITENTFEGSTFHYEPGFKQSKQPKINSECGNVWGYEGSTGDVDWSWDYHRMMNTFRKYPEIAGWLYTEHHDVINEWNGYWRFDRSNKFTGVESIFPGMKLNDFHAPVYLSTGNEISRTVKGGERITIPLYLSSMTDADYGKQVKVTFQLQHINSIGESMPGSKGSRVVDYQPYIQKELDLLELDIPNVAGLSTLTLQVEDLKGVVLHRNFMHFEVLSDATLPKTQVLTVRPEAFSNASFSKKQWNVLDGLKVNGAGDGYFEYTFPIDGKLLSSAKEVYFLVEISSKPLLVKDLDTKERTDVNFMLGAKASPDGNPNAYPMTDEKTFPSKVVITVNGQTALTTTLPDDPADHLGVLSWHHQLQDKKLREAGTYGYLTKVAVSKTQLKNAAGDGKLVIQIKTVGDGGIAVYGKSFGRYPLDPSLVIKSK